ncbi:hypothetical protein G7Y89_g10988 [Cudoniella acicularis]|uniref:Uncharacterized protein n=1 Tax=Cudoniella acicularis TaxID=354080 RepID=A0A8H4RE00_9HELO|nr:hypothetical protein G7Y89_g10988 [Cudoniella acicularis]
MDASPPPYSETPPDPLSQPVTNNSLSYNPRISDDPFSQNNQLPNPTSIPDTSSKFFIRRIDNSPGSIGTPGSLETRQTTTIIPSLSPPIEHIFPQAFGFYHASMSDMVIALSAPSSTSRPLFYISTHNTFTIKPDIVLHSRNYEASPPLATVTFHSFTNIKDLDIFLPSGRVQESLQSEGLFNPVYSFTINVGRLGVGEFARERFEWKSSNGNEVQALNGGKSWDEAGPDDE